MEPCGPWWVQRRLPGGALALVVRVVAARAVTGHVRAQGCGKGIGAEIGLQGRGLGGWLALWGHVVARAPPVRTRLNWEVESWGPTVIRDETG